MRWMRGLALVVVGFIAGALFMQTSAAPQQKGTGLRLNHVGLYVKNFDESVNFYTKTMGFREAFAFKDKDGKPIITYLQLDRDTFLELAPATADHPVGVSHMGLWADNVKAIVATLRERGLQAEDIRIGQSKAPLTNVLDPNGVRIELLEYPPESLQRKAMEAWK